MSTEFTARDWKSVEKNTLCGFCTIETPGGVIYKEVSIHERDGKRWIALPSRPWQKSDGTTGYVQVIEFRDKEVRERFQIKALAAIDKLLGKAI